MAVFEPWFLLELDPITEPGDQWCPKLGPGIGQRDKHMTQWAIYSPWLGFFKLELGEDFEVITEPPSLSLWAVGWNEATLQGQPDMKGELRNTTHDVGFRIPGSTYRWFYLFFDIGSVTQYLSLVSLSALIGYNWHIITCTYLRCTIWCPSKHHHNQDNKHTDHITKFLQAFLWSFPLPPTPGNHLFALYHYRLVFIF